MASKPPKTPKQPKNVTLGEMADRINSQFSRHLDSPISQRTPYDWWKRTKTGDISEPMPKPVVIVGRSPLFRWSDIIGWFVRYHGIGARRAGVEVNVDEGGLDG
jgi:hypothetical protein